MGDSSHENVLIELHVLIYLLLFDGLHDVLT